MKLNIFKINITFRIHIKNLKIYLTNTEIGKTNIKIIE